MKKLRIIILSAIIVAALACVALAAVYFTTDTFKSNKQLFLKYASQMKVSDLVDTDFYYAYQNKLKASKIEETGSIVAEGSSGGGASEEDYRVDYAGRSDNANNLSVLAAQVTAGGSPLLQFKYLNNDDIYGINIDGILNGYIAVQNKNLKSLAEKLDMDWANVPDKIDFSNTLINDADKKAMTDISNKYLNIILGQLTDKNFTKLGKTAIKVDEKNIQADGYKMSISGKEAKNIFAKIKETADNDQDLFNLINKLYFSNGLKFSDYQSAVDELLSGINVQDDNAEWLVMNVYQINGRIIGTNLTVNGTTVIMEYGSGRNILTISTNGMSVKITRTPGNSGESYDIAVTPSADSGDNSTYSINYTRTGDINSNTVENKVAFIASDNQSNTGTVTWDDKTNFVDSVDIEKFSNGNYVLLNNVPKDQLQGFLTDLNNKIMDKLGENKIQ
ncbi:MAG: hypothetical protein FWC53_02855 [Firmicutes bacterium]|nr:hypothetical protein [Bacillota bacterium]